MSGIKIEFKPKDLEMPSKFTPERTAAIVHAIARRVPYEYAAEANGICEDTLYEWLRRGRKDRAEGKDSDHAKFLENVKRAEMQRICEHMDIISDRPRQWQADAWILERRWNKHFGTNSLIGELEGRLNKIENGETNEGIGEA
jgi:hypothetical protein